MQIRNMLAILYDVCPFKQAEQNSMTYTNPVLIKLPTMPSSTHCKEAKAKNINEKKNLKHIFTR